MNTYWRVPALGLMLLAAGCNKSDNSAATSVGTTGGGATAGGAAAGGAPSGGAPSGGAAAGGITASAAEPDKYVQEFIYSLGDGDVSKLWTSLPSKYQADAKAIIGDAAANIDPELYDKSFALATKATLVLKTKKDFLLKFPPIEQNVPDMIKVPVVEAWSSIVGGLEMVLNSEIKTHAGLKSADPGQFLAKTGNELVKIGKSSHPLVGMELDSAKKTKVSLVKVEGDTATLKFETDDKPPHDRVYKKVEGKWLPAAMVDGWDKTIADLRADMDGLKITPEKKTEILGLVQSADGALDRMLAAPDQATFDKETAGLLLVFNAIKSATAGPGGPGSGLTPHAGTPGTLTLPGGGIPGQGIPAGLPGGVPLGTGIPSGLPLGTGARAPQFPPGPTLTPGPSLTPPVPALPK